MYGETGRWAGGQVDRRVGVPIGAFPYILRSIIAKQWLLGYNDATQ